MDEPNRMDAVVIEEHRPGSDVSAFIKAGHAVFAGDPHWIAPLAFELKGRLNPKSNPLFDHAEVALFTARRGGRLVGRVSATVDRAWQKEWGEPVGHFGFFDTLDDPEVASALLGRAEDWLREREIEKVVGPMSLNANEEVGLLVEGFEHPPVVMMGHSRAWQGKLLEGAGYAKVNDLYCWRFDAETPLSARTTRAWESIHALPEVRLRPVNMKRLAEELAVVVDIYNEAWAGKWAFVPISQREVAKMVSDLSLVLDPEIAIVAEIDGEPIGMCIMVPNIHEAMADLGGRLFPFGWAKFLYRLKVSRPRSTRLILLGIRERVRKNVKRYGGLAAAMMVEARQRGIARNYAWSELSWTRADDAPINLGIRSMGAKHYKTYRVYDKVLSKG